MNAMRTMMAVVAFALATGNVKADTDIRVSISGSQTGGGKVANSLIDPIYVKYLRNLPGITVVPTGETCDFTIEVTALCSHVKGRQAGYVWASEVLDANLRLVRATELFICPNDLHKVEQNISEEIMELEPRTFQPFRQSTRSN
jgi:hypothetical protein